MDLHHLLGRAKAVTAIATVGAAFVAAGPAAAEPNTTPPAKKGCEVQLKGPGAGQSVIYEDGYSFSVKNAATGKTHTYTCKDGTWVETVALTASPLRFGGVAVTSATLRLA